MSESPRESEPVQSRPPRSTALRAAGNVALFLNLMALVALCIVVLVVLPRFERQLTEAQLPVSPMLASIAAIPSGLAVVAALAFAAVLIAAHIALRGRVGGVIFAGFATLALGAAIVLFWVAIFRSVTLLIEQA